MSELDEINEKLTTVIVHTKNINSTIIEMKEERNRNVTLFTDNMNALKDALNTEKLERVEGDNLLKTDIKVAKTKIGFIVAAITTAITLASNWLLRK